MAYSREEWDWMEAEWAFHLHGRSAFLSSEDFRQLQLWEGEGVPPEIIVNAMGAYFERRAKRPRPRAFVKVEHIAKDVAKGLKLKEALSRGEAPAADFGAWSAVSDPLRTDPRARIAFENWQRLKALAPSPDSPGFLDHFDAERSARKELLALAEAMLGPQSASLRKDLEARLIEAQLKPESLVWKRAFQHHWELRIAEAFIIPT
jgi:hypothetical protein